MLLSHNHYRNTKDRGKSQAASSLNYHSAS